MGNNTKKLRDAFLEEYNSAPDRLLNQTHFEEMLDYWKNARKGRLPINLAFIEDVFNDKKNDPYSNENGQIRKEYIVRRCLLLDAIYATQLKEGFDSMVDNIARPNIKERIESGDLKVVDDIKGVYSARAVSEQKQALSFASKYCFTINPKCFPIYDSVVEDMLVAINKETHFYSLKTKLKIHADYQRYKDVVDKFISYYACIFPQGEANYAMFDRYLWTWGKKLLGMK